MRVPDHVSDLHRNDHSDQHQHANIIALHIDPDPRSNPRSHVGPYIRAELDSHTRTYSGADPGAYSGADTQTVAFTVAKPYPGADAVTDSDSDLRRADRGCPDR